MEHPEDYENRFLLEVMNMKTLQRMSFGNLSSEDVNKLDAIGVVLKPLELDCGFRMWVLGYLNYIGPPERHPEKKYETKNI